MVFCEYCFGEFPEDYTLWHHESYSPEKLVLICRKCHAIEHSKLGSPSRVLFLKNKGIIKESKYFQGLERQKNPVCGSPGDCLRFSFRCWYICKISDDFRSGKTAKMLLSDH